MLMQCPPLCATTRYTSSVVAVIGAPGVESAAVVDIISELNIAGDINLTATRSSRCEERVRWVPSAKLNETVPRHGLRSDPFAFKLPAAEDMETVPLTNPNSTAFGVAVAIGAQAIIAGSPNVITWHDTNFNHTHHVASGALAAIGFVCWTHHPAVVFALTPAVVAPQVL